MVRVLKSEALTVLNRHAQDIALNAIAFASFSELLTEVNADTGRVIIGYFEKFIVVIVGCIE